MSIKQCEFDKNQYWSLSNSHCFIDNPKFIKQCEFDNDQYWFFHSSIVTDDIILNHENDQFDFFEKTELPQNLWSFFKTVLDEI